MGRHFFETMGIPILIGRAFDDRDREGSPPVAVVNEQFVKAFFAGANPIGKTVRNGETYQIVGVCADTPLARLRAPVPPTFYRQFAQVDEPGGMTFEVRATSGKHNAILEAVRDVVRGLDRDLLVFDVRTQTQQIDALLSRERLFTALTTAFGGLALVLASIGIYGLLAHGVARRTNEIGVRLALGAERRKILFMVLREASSLASLGASIGIVVAVAFNRYISSILYGVTPADPVTLAGAVAVMMAGALLAAWIPARHASRLDPVTALRHE